MSESIRIRPGGHFSTSIAVFPDARAEGCNRPGKRARYGQVPRPVQAIARDYTRYRNGLVSELELLDVQRTELANRRTAVQVRGAQHDATIALIRALGGWDIATSDG
jgi:hypothetical protein